MMGDEAGGVEKTRVEETGVEETGVEAAGAASVGADTGDREEPWIETRQGSWFFVNALLVAPELVVLFPLALGMFLSFLAPDRELSPFLDTIPFVASKTIPFLGWLLVIPIWTTIRNLRMDGLRFPRVALGFFLVLHLGFLGYTVWSWVG